MEIFTKHRSASSAVVRIAAAEGRVSGTIRGPFCAHSRTLTTTFPLAPDGEARIVDPCYWTPHLPFYYQVKLESAAGSEAFDWSIRRLETHRRDLRLDGQRFVLRAVGPAGDSPSIDLPALRDSCTALYAQRIDNSLFREASQVGVLLVVDLTGMRITAELMQRLNRHPAVHLVVVPTDIDLAALPRSDLLAACWSERRVADAGPPLRLIHEKFLAGRQHDPHDAGPILAVRTVSTRPPGELRDICDRLQSDLAATGQYAGYVVLAADAC